MTKQQISTSMHLTAECLFVFPFGRCRLGFSLSFLNKLTPPYLILFRLQRNSRELFASLQVRHWIHTWYTLSFSCSIKMVRYFILCVCVCVFCSQAGPSLVADLRRTLDSYVRVAIPHSIQPSRSRSSKWPRSYYSLLNN